ncbi:serine/threonine protein kinase [Myxococcus hansupus]|uniref:non-specific serine/threonine protein kinase n=1 Tax=Pseudomyxococcus hansupus TaxID=1297742 RepID=A0A0H4WTU8_9BACT|nr:serine/threonine-protein kinase [Myxococcus hansupus]AKQ66891.1 serine/threonine protein kinase [Myxococcus hansupus]
MNVIPLFPSPGVTIDGWSVVRELGNGGFAVVYLVEKHGCRCALKLARHRDSSGDDKQTHARTLRELSALLLLDHPNIVKHRGYGYSEQGNVYLALEYVEGWTLAEWAERKHPTVQEVLQVFDKISAALSYMHGRGVLHRDLKLSNVLIRKSDGEPVIIDFSCASYSLAEELTDWGLPPGTDRFRAPEQFTWLREHKAEQRAKYAFQVADEIFAVGAMLYELLTDPRPTEVQARVTLNSTVMKPPPARALNVRVPEALNDLVDCILSREPSRRPVDTEALRRELGELLVDSSAEYLSPVHPPSEQRPLAPPDQVLPAVANPGLDSWTGRVGRGGRGLLAGISALIALVVAGGFWLSQGERTQFLEPPVAGVARPSGPPHSAPLMSTAPAMSLRSPPPVLLTGPVTAAPKEGSTVKTTPSPEVPPQGRQSRGRTKAAVAADCATMTLVAALAAGCPSAQIRPEAFTCPAGAEDVMREDLRWKVNQSFALTLDARHETEAYVWFTAGAEVMGVVPKGVPSDQRAVAPPGTRFYGKAYFLSDRMGRSEGPALVIRYDRVKLPGQDERPVCFVVESPSEGYEDGRVKAYNLGGGYVVDRWP